MMKNEKKINRNAAALWSSEDLFSEWLLGQVGEEVICRVRGFFFGEMWDETIIDLSESTESEKNLAY